MNVKALTFCVRAFALLISVAIEIGWFLIKKGVNSHEKQVSMLLFQVFKYETILDIGQWVIEVGERVKIEKVSPA